MEHAPFDITGLGSRLRRLSQGMLADVDRAYAAAGLTFRTRLFPVVYALHRDGAMTVGELVGLSGFTQPAVSQTLRKLEKDGYVTLKPGRDARERQVALSDSGRKLVDSLQPFWNQARAAINGLLEEVQPDFMAALASMETALTRRNLFDRIQAQSADPPREVIALSPFSIEYKQAFYDLNREWVETLFVLEAADVEQLEHPERILEQGGEIWFALLDGKPVGTGALYCKGAGKFELAKMAVTPELRGHGIGAKLMDKLVQRFVERGGTRLYLETNSSLKPAIALYERFGFVHVPPDAPSEYARADTFMEWRSSGR